MVRNYKRKTQQGKTTNEEMEAAVRRVTEMKESVLSVAKASGISCSTLRKYCIQQKNLMEDSPGTLCVGYFTATVFPPEQEAMFVKYVLHASSMYLGLCLTTVKKLAYEYASKLGLKVPPSWVEKRHAGKDWMTHFIKRHPSLSLKRPEAANLSKVTGFNRQNVKLFFDNYTAVMHRGNFCPDQIWNLDETGCTTVHKQDGTVVSAERAQLVTLCCAINSIGNTIPPMFIFPSIHYSKRLLHGAPVGSICDFYPSGWMTSDSFLTFIKHFVKYTNATVDRKVLLLLDNHESHISVPAIDYAKDNGVVMLSFPPHCSNKLQPLDCYIYGVFKRHYTSACDSWMLNHPGETISIYEIAALVGIAFPKAMTPTNIQSGFHVSGIFPVDPDICTDDEFLPSEVTDRPIPQQPPEPLPAKDCTHQQASETL